ncbi:MAG: methylenetetrahydrofolate reductase [NAD(P)H] [Opitutales bacterium]|nr:methylenetetrahydrofolate reductase [NAD(P)H] [Opitutales bacterium]
MHLNRPISDLLVRNRPVLSIEFFPPKDEEGGVRILRVAKELREQLQPDFVSITYGAGGSTQECTHQYAKVLKEDLGFEVMPHLTCVGASNEELTAIIARYQKEGFCNLMALRGDPPKGSDTFVQHPDGPRYATDLVKLIRRTFAGFSLGVAGYPEKHPESPSAEEDLLHLKEKVEAGASFITTQLFFDNSKYFDFVTRCRKIGIEVPIIPGIMPALSYPQVQRFCAMCGAEIPEALSQKLEAAENDKDTMESVGIDWAKEQIVDLIRNGAPGIHLYILNRAKPALKLLEALRSEGIFTH